MPPGDRFPFVRSTLHLDEVDSTSDLARRLLAEGTIEPPALIRADRQTRGRGQRSNSWWSDSGSLTATLVLDPSALGLSPGHEPRVALATATAVVDAITELYPSCRPRIRWPNDVEVDGRKLGGILPERVEATAGPRLLVGIGLNVRTRLADAPEAVRRMAATLGDWAAVPPSGDPRGELLVAILGRLGQTLDALAADDPDLARRWDRLDALAGSTVRVEVGPERIEGIGEGIDDRGGLILRVGGRLRVVHAGRVLRDGEPG